MYNYGGYCNPCSPSYGIPVQSYGAPAYSYGTPSYGAYYAAGALALLVILLILLVIVGAGTIGTRRY
ncbi:sporulation protein YjcZ [Evansella tamaricis]|uniref:sporulation protein YjcZ n=1 Tax=Evansella tamaricis TaxID=2069301 RepID=UPI001FE9C796|nr:sporulation protein YjcZ [Evansella tamaricis]